MLLRNQDRYLDLLHVDVASDVRERREAVGKSTACDGFFFEHNGCLFALGAEAGELYVILNGELLNYDASTLQTRLDISPDANTFSATQRSETLCRVTYTPVMASGWVPMEDDECTDGFLWMHNVLRDPVRRSIIVMNAAKSG